MPNQKSRNYSPSPPQLCADQSVRLKSTLQKEEAQRGEDFIAAKLEAIGCRIVARNYRRIGSEIDIAALYKKTLVIVEVKVRNYSPRFSVDMEALLPRTKRQALARGAKYILQEYHLNPQTVRFDLAILAKSQRQIVYYKNVFQN